MPRTPFKRLSAKEVYILTNFVKEHYSAKKMSDKEFAAFAEKELAMPGLSYSHVDHSRDTLGIPSTRQVTREGRTRTLISRVEELEATVKAMTAQLARLDRRTDPHAE